jgi:hypothetical protein
MYRNKVPHSHEYINIGAHSVRNGNKRYSSQIIMLNPVYPTNDSLKIEKRSLELASFPAALICKINNLATGRDTWDWLDLSENF